MQPFLVLHDQGHILALNTELATMSMVVKITSLVGRLLGRRNMRVFWCAHSAGALSIAECRDSVKAEMRQKAKTRDVLSGLYVGRTKCA